MRMKWLAPGARDDRIFAGTISATQPAMEKTVNALWERVPDLDRSAFSNSPALRQFTSRHLPSTLEHSRVCGSSCIRRMNLSILSQVCIWNSSRRHRQEKHSRGASNHGISWRYYVLLAQIIKRQPLWGDLADRPTVRFPYVLLNPRQCTGHL